MSAFSASCTKPKQMTFVVAATGQSSIWLLTDTRLTHADGTFEDTAIKQFLLETTDGTAYFGYTGLGMTFAGNEPSQWMSNVLRGLNLPLEQSLSVLTNAIQKQIPRHMEGTEIPHVVVAPALVMGQPRMYVIQLARRNEGAEYECQFRRILRDESDESLGPPRLVFAGSGVRSIPFGDSWKQELLNMILQFELGEIDPERIEQFLAEINLNVSKKDATVAPQSLINWRIDRQTRCNGNAFFNGTNRETVPRSIPTVNQGMDVSALLRIVTPQLIEVVEALRIGEAKEIDRKALDAQLRSQTWTPDDHLE